MKLIFYCRLYFFRNNVVGNKGKMMPSPGFEPESSDRKSEMIDRTTPQGQKVSDMCSLCPIDPPVFVLNNLSILGQIRVCPMDPPGFEPGIYASLKQ